MRITVKDFSALREVDVEISKVTIITGQQASGKSLLCKLVAYANEVSSRFLEESLLNKDENYKDMLYKCQDRFKEYFPVRSWGDKMFEISYYAEGFNLKITRKSGGKGKTKKPAASVSISSNELQKVYTEGKEKVKASQSLIPQYQQIQKLIESLNVNEQLYIPAGRSYFTSLRRMAGLVGSQVDPITTDFARFFGNINDLILRGRMSLSINDDIDKKFKRIFAGEPVLETRAKSFIISTGDGRKTTFDVASSGQSELWPVWLSILHLYKKRFFNNKKPIVYFEEPETHLYPSSQVELIDVLARAVGEDAKIKNLILTTHSPYVLSYLNNLIYAGSLYERGVESLRKKLEKIISRGYTINPKDVRAYVIEDGVAKSIIGKSGLIRPDFLDAISRQVTTEFERLMEIS